MSQMNTTYSTSASYGANYGTTYVPSVTTTGAYVPQYHFQSTSSFTSIVNTTAYNEISANMFNDAAPSSRGLVILRDSWDDPDEYDPIGVRDNPIGEPLILLAFALLFALLRLRRRKAM